jgi:hypothetical protein
LREAFKLYAEPEARLSWLRSLSSSQLALLDPAALPEEFQSAESGAP